MRSLWILLGAVLLISLLFSCQPAGAALPVSDNGNGSSGPLSTVALNITGPMDESIIRSSPVSVTGNTEPGADVLINGASVETDNGHFSALVELEPGPNMIEVLVKNSSGQQASKYLTVVYVP